MYPVQRARASQLGSAALLDVRGAEWLLLARNTPPGGYHVPTALHELCGSAYGVCGVPREVTCENEPFVTILSHVHLQEATEEDSIRGYSSVDS